MEKILSSALGFISKAFLPTFTVVSALGFISKAFLPTFTVVVIILVLKSGGFSGLKVAFRDYVLPQTLSYKWALAMFFTISGCLGYLSKKHPDIVKKLLTGDYGIIPMIAACSILPGPAGASQLREAFENGTMAITEVLLCLVAMTTFLNFTMVIFRGKMLGHKLSGLALTVAMVNVGLLMLFRSIFRRQLPTNP